MAQVNSENSTAMPARVAGELYRRTDISPETFFQALGRVRRAARDEIERLIAWLDSTIECDEDSAVDDDPCDGDTDAEPNLGSFDSMSNQIKAWQTRFVTADVDCELDRCDNEPSLGSCEGPGPMPCGMGGQEYWARGNTDEREGDGCADDREGDELDHGGDEHDGREPDDEDELHDGREPDVDDEPTFGWSDEEAARGRYPSLMGAVHEGDL